MPLFSTFFGELICWPYAAAQTLKEFNLFWLTSIPQSFAPQWNIPLYHSLVSSNQQLVDLLFTIFEQILFFEEALMRIYPSSPSTTLPGNFVVFNHPGTYTHNHRTKAVVAYLLQSGLQKSILSCFMTDSWRHVISLQFQDYKYFSNVFEFRKNGIRVFSFLF